MKTIRASEIGLYLYCKRAWWYQRQHAPNQNQAELAAGSDIHERHGRLVMVNGCMRALAYILLLTALALSAAAITRLLL
jgi:CRISPR/Cas system-associated exonuclease Cas4 (RecB family)